MHPLIGGSIPHLAQYNKSRLRTGIAETAPQHAVDAPTLALKATSPLPTAQVKTQPCEIANAGADSTDGVKEVTTAAQPKLVVGLAVAFNDADSTLAGIAPPTFLVEVGSRLLLHPFVEVVERSDFILKAAATKGVALVNVSVNELAVKVVAICTYIAHS